ncbi:MAG: Ada metal-binding domain-containing protein [Chitinophagaceae bacterium]
MMLHNQLNTNTFAGRRRLLTLIRQGEVVLAGNRKLKIYGTLQCRSGKKMNVSNRVFFSSEIEAVADGYRPCAHCMPDKYREWKTGTTGLLL